MATAPSLGMPRAPSIVSILNPLIRRLLRFGMPFGPNLLMTVRGRSSGLDRTFPVAVLELGDRRFVQSPFGEVNWVRNLRAARSAVIAKGAATESVGAVELSPEQAGPILRDAFAPYVGSRLLRPIVRWYFGLRPDSTLADYVEYARRHPTFELLRVRAVAR